MRHLLRPARRPHPELVDEQLGITGSSWNWHDRNGFDEHRETMMELLEDLVAPSTVFVRTEEEGRERAFYGVYEFRRLQGEGSHGSASFAYMPAQRQKGAISVRVYWASLPADMEHIVPAVDRLWNLGGFGAMYAFDEFDCAIQNMDMPFGMEHYGLDASQVDVIKVGGVDAIDTRHNPGVIENRDGLLVSVQWLNYWSLGAQKDLFGGRPSRLPAGVELRDMDDGAVRVRLADKPGGYDSVAYHELQLKTRRDLGLL